jgi:phosphotriesterase-related protein
MTIQRFNRRRFLILALSMAATSLIPLTAIFASSGKVQTVLGEIDASELGVTAMHEHLFTGFSGDTENNGGYVPEFRKLAGVTEELFPSRMPVSAETLNRLRHGGWLLTYDHWGSEDVNAVIHEVEEFKKRGGNSLLCVTPIGLRIKDNYVKNMQAVSRATGVNIILSTGLYGNEFWPKYMKGQSEVFYYDYFMKEITQGIGDTGVKTGSVKIGINNLSSADEAAALMAGARAAAKANIPLTIHIGVLLHWSDADGIIDVLERSGIHPDKVILGHFQGAFAPMDIKSRITTADRGLTIEHAKKFLDKGYNIAIDTWGIEDNMRMDIIGMELDRDEDMLIALYQLLKAGYADQIVLGHDAFSKLQMTAHGGAGLTRILDYVLPELKKADISETDILKLSTGNPARLLMP